MINTEFTVPAIAGICIAVISMLSVAQASGQVTLIDAGQPAGAIVLSPGASESERWAAEELQTHLRTMSGATLPIREQGEGLVYLGQAALDAGIIDSIDDLGTDGFVIRTRDGKLGIAGSPVRGTMYGVFTVLHDLGCRWWTPTESTIPQLQTVAVQQTDRRETPQLEYRDMMYMEVFPEPGQIWAARNRVNGMAWQATPAKYGGRYHFVGNLVHSYNQLMHDSGLELEPEMWALVNGQRRPNSQPCLTHPKTLEAMTISVRKRFEQHPDTEFVVVGQNDNHDYCRCDNCAAVAEREGSQAGHVIEFANALLDNIKADLPDARIATPAYQWSRKPPKHVRPHEDVIVVLCSIEADFHRPLGEGSTKENAAFKEDIEGWHQIANTLFIWDYTTNFLGYLMPHPNLDALVPNVQFFARQGAGGVFEQGSHTGASSEFYGLRMWVLARALWDAEEADGEALIAEFLDGYYGPAASDIRQYIDIIHRPGRERKGEMRMGTYANLSAPYVAPELIAEAEAVLRQAAERVQGNPQLESRIRHARLPVWYVLAKRGPESLTWRLVEEKVGQVSFQEVADGIAAVHAERGLTQLAEGYRADAWLTWVTDYASQLSQGSAPRASEAPDAVRRVIQAGHMDPHHARGEWLERQDGASDGWAMKSPTHAWLVRHFIIEHEDFEPGREYRMMVRIRAEGLADGASGSVARLGMHGPGPGAPSTTVDAETLRGGQWQVVEVGKWKPTHGQGLWLGPTPEANRDKQIEAIYLDCFWLEPVEAE
jgi:hypothetical protein